MTARVVFTPDADADSVFVLHDVAADYGHRVAKRFAVKLERLFDRLERFPLSGASGPTLGYDIRIGVVSPFLIIYRHAPATNDVIVLRIVHGRREISKKLLPP